MFNGTIITNAGQNVLSYCLANELPVKFTYMKLGDGILSELREEELTELIAPKQSELIQSKFSVNGVYQFNTSFTNEALTAGFFIRECGIFAYDPVSQSDVLFAYDNAGTGSDVDFFSPGNGKVILKEIFEIAATIGNAANVELSIEPSFVYITEEQFNNYKSKDILISNISIEPSDWNDNKYMYPIQGVTEEDLPIVWFSDTELANDNQIEAETIEGGIEFTCETVPPSTVILSLEVKKVEGENEY